MFDGLPWQSLLNGRKAAAAFRSKGGERDMSAYLLQHYKSL